MRTAILLLSKIINKYSLAFVLMISFYEISAQVDSVYYKDINIEKKFPCWYCFGDDLCEVDSAESIALEIAKMDTLISYYKKTLIEYYKSDSLLNTYYHNDSLSAKIVIFFQEWHRVRDNFSFLYFNDFIIGSNRGLNEMLFRRDFTKQFLLCVSQIIKDSP